MTTHLTPAAGPFYSSMVNHDWQALGFPALKAARFWDTRSCGVACLRMVYGRLKPGLDVLPATIIEELLRAGAYSEQFGWNHEGLALHARKYGLEAERMHFRTQETFMAAVRESGAIIVSVGHSFETEGKSGHLAVVAGITEPGHLWIHLPSSRHPTHGKAVCVGLTTFWDHFSGRGIRFSIP
ncbi:cysteine peptidase family C39 domain-containing protein [Arthrobacter bambusae]|uniref:Peptidase C39 domain-containing protein n=1 Tax=Arthrobacter bambusae TaxID=1338426 RepID=A0AAW8D2Z6_9MICC|nr:cysteine peptidase family C39 domain-containing protein [Arthrobacter bambusae]MDP9903266.1 hypothetical protein [Arthrobacter bambusae]MDQ0128740.1 hypothetical protein [Arthrobacter bambusae]MDQ0180081.1 hypothetical protein [Arthrobacter bambusae]